MFSKLKTKDIIQYFIKNYDYYEINTTPLFGTICKSIETKGWVDIENEYYNFLRSFLKEPKYKDPATLNKELYFIKDKLIEYLTEKRGIIINSPNFDVHKIFKSRTT